MGRGDRSVLLVWCWTAFGPSVPSEGLQPLASCSGQSVEGRAWPRSSLNV